MFSVAGAYELLGGFLHLEKADVWNKVWKLHVTERVRAFIWQITHGKLLTNAQKHQWGLGAPFCPHCPNELETILHALRDCSLAMTVWNQLVRPSDRGAFYLEDLEDWISSNLTKNLGSGSMLEWASLWGFTCHQLWQWRNKSVHVPSFRRSPWPWMYVSKCHKEYQHVIGVGAVGMGRASKLLHICWQPPQDGWIALHMNGASRSMLFAGCGGLLRGAHGEWLGGFSRNLGITSAYEAELWGVLEGLLLARRLGFQMVDLRIDSTCVVNGIQGKATGCVRGVVLVTHIRKLLDVNWAVRISHVYREANKCADCLANIGCDQQQALEFYVQPPLVLEVLLDNDVRRVFTPRLVPM